MITTYRYNAGNNRCVRTEAELPDIQSLGEDVLWVDLQEPTPEEEQRVLERFLPVHPLTLEDITRPRRLAGPPHFPKVEEFPDYLFVIVNPLSPQVAAAIEAGQPLVHKNLLYSQLSAVLTHSILITHHYEPLVAIDELRIYLQKHDSQAARGPDYLFHLVLDVMVDQYAPLLDRFADALDRIETRVFLQPKPALLARLLQLKRYVLALRKTLVYEREVLARLARGEFRLIDQREMVYYRNVYDHLIRFTELIEGSRDMVSDLMQTHLASVSNRLSEIMKVLTMISTTILPMSLIAGIYGMNFEHNMWPHFKDDEHGFAIALGMMALSGVGALGLFRWMKWI